MSEMSMLHLRDGVTLTITTPLSEVPMYLGRGWGLFKGPDGDKVYVNSAHVMFASAAPEPVGGSWLSSWAGPA